MSCTSHITPYYPTGVHDMCTHASLPSAQMHRNQAVEVSAYQKQADNRGGIADAMRRCRLGSGSNVLERCEQQQLVEGQTFTAELTTEAASLRMSRTTAARASGFTPFSHRPTRMASVSRSRPVLSSREISYTAICGKESETSGSVSVHACDGMIHENRAQHGLNPLSKAFTPSADAETSAALLLIDTDRALSSPTRPLKRARPTTLMPILRSRGFLPASGQYRSS